MLPSNATACENYLHVGQQLPWTFIVGLLMLTTWYTKLLAGLHGAVYHGGCLDMKGWETIAALAYATDGIVAPRFLT